MATILIVDDDAANRLLLTTLLRPAGHELVEASDAREAQEALASRKVDVAIVDLTLPRVSGAELIRRVRRDPTTVQPAIVLYTASGIDALTRDFMDAYGVAGAIPKPCEPQCVARIVDDALQSGARGSG